MDTESVTGTTTRARLARIAYPRDFDAEDTLLDAPQFVVARLAGAGATTVAGRFRFVSRTATYVLRFDRFDAARESWDVTPLWFGRDEERGGNDDTLLLSRILRARRDVDIEGMDARALAELRAIARDAPWMACFPLLHPHAEVLDTLTVDEAVYMRRMDDRPLSRAAEHALRYAADALYPRIADGAWAFRHADLPPGWSADVARELTGPLGLFRWITDEDVPGALAEPLLVGVYDDYVQRRLARLLGAIARRDVAAPPRAEPEYTRADLDASQRRAVALATARRVCVVIGGAGSGKTTVIKEIVHQFADADDGAVLLAAFTGKAAQRMGAVAGGGARTMHRVTVAAKYFARRRPEVRVAVIDEASMVPAALLCDFLGALPNVERLVLVGQAEQLPPIGRGAVLEALLSRYLPRVACAADIPAQAAAAAARGVAVLDHDHRTCKDTLLLAENRERILMQYPLLRAERDGGGPHSVRGHPCAIHVRSGARADDLAAFFALPGRSPRTAQLLTHTRAEAHALNEAYAALCFDHGAALSDAAPRAARRPLHVGEKIIFRKNFYGADVGAGRVQYAGTAATRPAPDEDPDAPARAERLDAVPAYMNGEIAFIRRIVDVAGGEIADVADLAEPPDAAVDAPARQRWVLTSAGAVLVERGFYRAADIQRAYAVTIASFQGDEVPHVGLYIEEEAGTRGSYYCMREFYVAYSRASRSVDIYLPTRSRAWPRASPFILPDAEAALRRIIAENTKPGGNATLPLYLPADLPT